MISEADLSQITGFFVYLKLISSSVPAQNYDKAQPYRLNTLIAVRKGRNIDYVFVNVALKDFTPWKKNKWEERKIKVSRESFNVETKHPDIIRLGFK